MLDRIRLLWYNLCVNLWKRALSARTRKVKRMTNRFPQKAAALLLLACIFSGCTATGINNELTDSSFSSAEASSSAEITSSTEEISSSVQPEPEPEPLKLAPDYDGFSKAMDKTMSYCDIMGMSVAVFKDDEILYTYSGGYADYENKIPFTADTRSRVASVSKMVTSMVMMTLYDQQKIGPASNLSDVTGLPFDVEGKEKIKLWHLMTHTAGFRDTEDFNVKHIQDAKYLLKNSHTSNEPGTAYLYTNFGLGVAGAVIECVSGEYFFDYADKMLFKPLGMDAGYNISMISDKASVAKLYDYSDDSVTDVKNWSRTKYAYTVGGIGNSCYCAQCELIINAKDLARLGMMMTNDGTLDGVKVLSRDAVSQMEMRFFSAPDYDMGLSVRIYDNLIDDRTIYGHNGVAFGAVTGLYYDPTDKTGVAVITNGCIPYSDKNGFYKVNKDALNAAYKYIFDTGDFAKNEPESNNSDTQTGD